MWENIKANISAKISTMSAKQKAFAAGGIILFILVIFLFLLFNLGSAKGTGDKISVQIKEGMTTTEIADTLENKGIIYSSFAFRTLARLHGNDTDFREGTYYFRHNMSANAALQNLIIGPENVVRIVIPEGFTIEDIGATLEQNDLVTKEEFCQAAKDFAPYDYMQEALKHKDIKYAAEGFLFPDTYDFDRSYSAKQIMEIMAQNFDQKLTPKMRQQAKDENLSIYELINMASLVEKEAKFEEDRPIIADVFFKRLAQGMMLQSDATIQYALSEHKEEFSIEDTKHNSPYNTYQHEGLPPGPIGNPGLASIEAVLQPAHTDYMYFVADSEGHNHYSVTYDEHLAIIDQIYGKN